jgi:hypothetical protein
MCLVIVCSVKGTTQEWKTICVYASPPVSTLPDNTIDFEINFGSIRLYSDHYPAKTSTIDQFHSRNQSMLILIYSILFAISATMSFGVWMFLSQRRQCIF